MTCAFFSRSHCCFAALQVVWLIAAITIGVTMRDAGAPCSVQELLDRPVKLPAYFLRDRAIAATRFTQRRKLESISRAIKCSARVFQGERWFVNGGSLLGSYRHSALLPFDKDCDVSLPYDDYLHALARMRVINRTDAPPFYPPADKAAWQRLAPQLIAYSDGDCAVQYSDKNASTRDDTVMPLFVADVGAGFGCDVWIGHVVNQSDRQVFRRLEFGRWLEMPLDQVFPLSQATLGRLVVPVPRNTSAYLRQSYGDIEHPYSFALELFTRLPSRPLCVVLVLALLPRWILNCFLRTRRLHGRAHQVRSLPCFALWLCDSVVPALLCSITATMLFTLSHCAGIFSLVCLCFVSATACVRGDLLPPLITKLTTAAAGVLALICVYSIRTWLAMKLDRYEFRDGEAVAHVLTFSWFDVDYRSFFNASDVSGQD
jgi:hypothetical protein